MKFTQTHQIPPGQKCIDEKLPGGHNRTLSASANSDLDHSFLKKEPYRKTKQKVDISSVKNGCDLAVIRTAINPIMRFLVGLSFSKFPPAVSDELLTERGRLALQLPPLRNEFKRYSVDDIRDWRVCGSDKLSFEATFSDLLRRNFWKSDFLFIKTESGWRFDDHRQLEC